MRQVNLVTWGELIEFVEQQGIADWNDAIDILDDIRLEHDDGYKEYRKRDFENKNAYHYDEQVVKIMLLFFEHHKVDSFILVED